MKGMLKGLGGPLLSAVSLLVASMAPIPAARAADEVTIKVAYSSDFVPLSPEAGKAYWDQVVGQFEKENPGVKVQRITVPGSYADVENKLSLLFRSPGTAPDVVELSNQDMVQWVDSGYLAPLDKWLANEPSWQGMPANIKYETTVDGKVYGISHGENEMGLLYDKALFAKAGIAVPWTPKTWTDVLEAARKIKATSPSAWPLWLPTGTAQGASGAWNGPNSVLFGSSDPTIYNAAAKKWVVDSKGLRETVGIYRTAAAEGLLAPSSQLLNANAIATPPTEIPKHRIGITLAGNWFTLQWTKPVSSPFYGTAFSDIGVAPVPTVGGQSPGVASSLGGWDMAIYSGSKQKELAWKFIQVGQQKKNMLMGALNNGWTPPVSSYANSSEWLNVDPFQKSFQNWLPHATPIPVVAGYNTWAMGLVTATEAVVLNPKLSVDDAMKKMVTYVTNQTGPDEVEVRK